MDRGVDKYLARYAEPEVAAEGNIAALSLEPWEQIVVVPAREEHLDSVRSVVASIPGAIRTLTIVVVNASERSLAGNRHLLGALSEAMGDSRRPLGSVESGGAMWMGQLSGRDVLVVDRDSEGRGLGPKEGVGKARKIGCDLALGLIREGWSSSPWIHSTDADARLPSDYFAEFASVPEVSVARVAPLWHEESGDSAIDEATARYELRLRYYVLGLAAAGSPYAFHTVGSLISVKAGAYAAVRGVPRRLAGEDFYLLNKLRKLGPVYSGRGEPVKIRSRISSRVPFGTGPAVEKLCAGEALAVYDPRCFEALGRVLGAMASLVEEGPSGQRWSSLSGAPKRYLEDEGIAEALVDLSKRQSGEALRMQVHAHFDAFRTLKFIHYLRDTLYPSLSWEEACGKADFLGGLTGSEDPLEQRLRLVGLEAGRARSRRN